MKYFGKYLVLVGVIFIVVGGLLYFGGNKFKWIGHLPGDIRIEKDTFHFYFPITTMILFSLLLTLLIRIYQWFR
ncbi:MAG: DUF2905 domain-containing protein [Fidelibacterota bacterium]